MIRVAYDDPEGALADGMPADVVAEIRGGGLPMIAGAYGQAGTEVDWNAVTKDISGTAMPFYQEQGLLQQPNVRQVNGRYFTEKPSAQMEWLRKQGYSDPREEYSVEMLAQGDDDLTRLVSGASEKASAYDTAAKRYDDEMKAIKRFNRGGPQAHQAAMEGQIQAMKRLTGKAVDTFGNLREMAANPNPAPIDNRPAYLRGGQPQPQVQMGDSGLSDLLAELESFRDTTKYRNQRLQATAPMPTTTRRDAGIRKRGVEKQSGAAAFALAKQLVPMFTAQRSGRTPYLDQKEARLNELRQMGLIR
jgi:DNA-binding transcriptional MerR regulator